YKRKRDLLAEALEAGGIIPMRGEGGFFLIGDTRNLKLGWAGIVPMGREGGFFLIGDTCNLKVTLVNARVTGHADAEANCPR
ncbi:hypothetical protein T484DRAFT_1846090, partial [Baffinella frigidus]